MAALLLYCFPAMSQTSDSAKQAKKQLLRSQLYQKHNFYVGAAFGSSVRNMEDLDLQFFAVDNLDRSTGFIRLDVGYFIKNNWALGMVGRYGRSRTDIDFLSVEGVPTNYQNATERYSLYLNSKNFIPLNAGSRFVFFTNSLLGGNWRNQLTESISNGVLQRSYSQRRQLELVIQPGVAFNIIKGLNIELATELISVGGNWSQSYLNGNTTSSSSKFSGSFRFNVLQTNFGVYYYFHQQTKPSLHAK